MSTDVMKPAKILICQIQILFKIRRIRIQICPTIMAEPFCTS